MNIKRKILIGAAVLAIVLLVGGVSSCGGQPKNISIDIIAPLHVAKGEEFVFEIQVENSCEAKFNRRIWFSGKETSRVLILYYQW